jgi:hypothetical protein
MGDAKSYSERLFDFPEIGPLNSEVASEAIIKPILNEGAEIDSHAVAQIISETKGYPYYLQEWGKHAWDIASQSPITVNDIENASKEAIATLELILSLRGFFKLFPLINN